MRPGNIRSRQISSVLPWWAFQRIRLQAAILLGRLDRFFEAELLGVNKSPHRPHVCFNAARSQLQAKRLRSPASASSILSRTTD